MDFEIGIIDRMLGCGTLVISDASSTAGSQLHDIPQVEQVQLQGHRRAAHGWPRDGPDDADDGA